MSSRGTRGILNPADGLTHFSLEREPAPPDLAHVVSGFWRVRWDLAGQPDFVQEILPYPCVNLSFQDGRFEVHGPGTQRFAARLSGRGEVFGTRFTPAGFSAFARVPMRSLVDRVLGAEEAMGCSLPLPADPGSARPVVAKFLLDFDAPSGGEPALVDRLVALAQEDRSIARAEQLAREGGVSVRTLHRMFERHVGVGPKWVVRRSRVQDAADRVARGERVDWAETARELGYHDQAHLIRDFRTQLGCTPAAYARRCSAAVAQGTSPIELARV